MNIKRIIHNGAYQYWVYKTIEPHQEEIVKNFINTKKLYDEAVKMSDKDLLSYKEYSLMHIKEVNLSVEIRQRGIFTQDEVYYVWTICNDSQTN